MLKEVLDKFVAEDENLTEGDEEAGVQLTFKGGGVGAGLLRKSEEFEDVYVFEVAAQAKNPQTGQTKVIHLRQFFEADQVCMVTRVVKHDEPRIVPASAGAPSNDLLRKLRGE